MARTTISAGGTDPQIVALTRMLTRLHQTLIIPDQETEARILASSQDREKLGDSIEYASTLLLQLEQEALTIKNPNQKQETQAELFKKRELILRLEERLGEYGYTREYDEPPEAEEPASSDGEDLLGANTPSSSPSHASTSDPTPLPVPDAVPPLNEPEPEPQFQPQPPAQTQTDSTLRARGATSHAQEKNELLGTSMGVEPTITTTTESLLTHNRTEQEALTTSLLSMASALKNSSKAFSTSLENEKDIVDRAADGMDKNTTGLEQASKKMGMLRSMSEGRGWWGRMLLYAWIAGLAVLAILIVFVGPKFRFSSSF